MYSALLVALYTSRMLRMIKHMLFKSQNLGLQEKLLLFSKGRRMKKKYRLFRFPLALCVLLISGAHSEQVRYVIDSSHTYPSFEADHMGGLSVWRGKINSSSGYILLDKNASTGAVDVTLDMSTIDFGHEGMNDHVRNEDMLDVEKFPISIYTGKLARFVAGKPTEVHGELTLRGITKPLALEINQFKCMIHPRKKREVCGADASAKFMRDDFGVDFAKQYGFKMDINLRISVEALVEQN